MHSQRNKKPDYSKYRFTKSELIRYVFLYTGGMCVISFLLYNSFYPLCILVPAEYFLLKETAKMRNTQRQKNMSKEFCDMISILAGNLSAGCSLEQAFYVTYDDMKKTYGSSLMDKELVYIIRGIQTNIPVEKLLLDFGERSDIPEIMDFAQVVAIAKKSGGNIVAIIRKTVEKIRQRQEVENEISVLVAGKRMEQRIMNIMPFAIIAYLRLTNPTYISGLYGNFVGVTAVTVCLVIICVSSLWSRRIVEKASSNL